MKWRDLPPPERSEKHTMSQHQPLEIGPNREGLITKLFQVLEETHGCTTRTRWEHLSGMLTLPNESIPESCMLAFLVKNRNLTSEDKSKLFRKSTRDGKLCLTSDLVSTITGPDFAGWWNESVEERSRKLWLPTKIDCVDSDLSCSNICVENTVLTSWFSGRTMVRKTPSPSSKKISSTSSTSLSLGEMENDPTSKKPPNGLQKTRLYPTTAQRSKLRQLFEANRWGWNELVSASKDTLFTSSVKDLKSRLRPLIQKGTMTAPLRITSVPEEVLDSTYRDFFKARKTILAASKAQKNKTGKGFRCKEVKFKLKKDSSGSIEVRARGIKTGTSTVGFWPQFFEGTKIAFRDTLPPINNSCRVQMTKNGRFYLCVPTYTELQEPTTDRVCAIDPGVRTMLTGYDPEQAIFELGTNIDELYKRLLLTDKIQAKLRHFVGKRNARYVLKKQKDDIHAKISRMVSDCHHKISKYLASKYQKILLPKFETKKMSEKLNRKIGKMTVRKMLTWSHYSFKELLRHKMALKGGLLVDCTEEYTSKTCTKCGRLNHKLGASKVFNCGECSFTCDRDQNAARNIYLKNQALLGK